MFASLFPLSIPSVITSVFGWRVHPISGNQRFHSGTDLGAPMGTPVLAALTGRVLLADFFGGYGLAIALEHSQGTQQTLYAHLSEIFVKPGEVIKQGTVIGRVGSTGNSTGPHLHFEFRQLTTQGWVAQDAGTQLESALAQLAQSLQTAQKIPAQPGNSKS
ncbi:MAG: M23 family metallopeptidase [Leptolyngbyaceae cyanobacterium SU_3_3]|nr:M23 family metallopeptidase [Leptolyngbyaceae cyanobacterium SU_3_3]